MSLSPPGTQRRRTWTSASLPDLRMPRSSSTAPRSVMTQSGRGLGPCWAPSQLDQRWPSGGPSGVVSTAKKSPRTSFVSEVGSREVRRVGGLPKLSFVRKLLRDKGDLQEGGGSGCRQHSTQSLTSCCPPWKRARPLARVLSYRFTHWASGCNQEARAYSLVVTGTHT